MSSRRHRTDAIVCPFTSGAGSAAAFRKKYGAYKAQFTTSEFHTPHVAIGADKVFSSIARRKTRSAMSSACAGRNLQRLPNNVERGWPADRPIGLIARRLSRDRMALLTRNSAITAILVRPLKLAGICSIFGPGTAAGF